MTACPVCFPSAALLPLFVSTASRNCYDGTMTSFQKRFAWCVLCVIALFVGLAYTVLCTTTGSALVVRWAVTRALRPSTVTIERVTGILVNGVSLYGVTITPTALAHTVTIARVDGQRSGVLTFHDIQAEGLSHLPPSSTLAIERLEATLPFRLEHLRSIQNGRLRLPDADPILVYGRREGDSTQLHVYTKSLDLQDVLKIVSTSPWAARIAGSLEDVHLIASGSLQNMAMTGSWHIARLHRDTFHLAQCNMQGTLQVTGLPKTPHLSGEITVLGGTLTARQTVVMLRPGKMIFTGDPMAPVLDLKGTSTIGDTKISIALKGSPDEPDLRLASDPPKPQQLLLLMLATGKPWSSIEGSLAEGQIPVDLAADFIDYFVFGGLGSQVASRFGLTGLSVRVDNQANTIGVQTTVGTRFSVGIETEQSALTAPPPPRVTNTPNQKLTIPLKVEAEYDVTDTTSIRVEGERRPLDHQGTTATSSQTGLTTPATPQTDDSLLLKIKKRF